MTRTGRPFTAARFARVVAGALGVALLGCLGALALGEPVDLLAVLTGGGTAAERAILLDLRVPRVLAAAAVGGGLAVAGGAFQGLLRNPLAEPYLLGISGGGSFGAVLTIVLLGSGAASAARGGGALVGCLLALSIVYWLASRRALIQPATLLLAGVVTNAFFLAGLSAVQFAATPTEAQVILRWVMGGLTSPRGGELLALGGVTLGATAVLTAHGAHLNLLAFGEETARSLGVDVGRVRFRVFVVTSLAVAASVAVAGPIGFVGLFVPHAVRLVAGSDHRVLLPAAFLVGAGFLPLADGVARIVLAPRELPVGVVTALVGAPLFGWLLARHRPGGAEAAW